MTALPPLSVYVHFPWCVRKCPYCDFNSHALTGDLPEHQYVAQLLRDIDQEAPQWSGREVQTIFLGGGTPSLFSADAIAATLAGIHAGFAVAADAEITLEANPGTADAGRFAGFRAAGVNRLSIGVQSFDDAALVRLGRIHDAASARAAIDFAHGAGFARVNVDLMHGLPGQTVASALQDLEVALASGVEHLSWYQLTIEPNTAFHRAPPSLPDEDLLEEIERRGGDRLAHAGLQRYEVSAWCRGDGIARHNVNYWRFGDYVGLGAGAHGKQTRAGHGPLEVLRYQKSRVPRDYLTDCVRRHARRIPDHELAFEFLLNALRLRSGVPDALFTAHTGQPLASLQPALGELRAAGLMTAEGLAATPQGWRYLDTLLQRFIAPSPAGADATS